MRELFVNELNSIAGGKANNSPLFADTAGNPNEKWQYLPEKPIRQDEWDIRKRRWEIATHK